MAEIEIPRAARVLAGRLDGWSVRGPNPGTGAWWFTVREWDQAQGVNHNVPRMIGVDSCGILARHVDGRCLWALWLRRHDPGPDGKARGWSFDSAWRGRHPHENVPEQVNARELTAYASAADAPSALAALAQVRSDAEHNRAAMALRRAAKKAAEQDEDGGHDESEAA